jgi:hypothetical protein
VHDVRSLPARRRVVGQTYFHPMKQPITSNDLIEIVLQHTTGDFRFEPYRTKPQKFLFWALVGCVACSIASGLASLLLNSRNWAFLGIVAFQLGAAAVVLYQGALLWNEARRMRNPEKEIALPLTKSFSSTMELIHNLATFEIEHLRYAKDVFTREARHLRERIGLMVGALDKIGAIPLAVTSYLSYVKMSQADPSFGALEVVGLCFIAFYVFAIRMVGTAQWMEKVAILFEHALVAREKRDESFRPQQRMLVSPSTSMPRPGGKG